MKGLCYSDEVAKFGFGLFLEVIGLLGAILGLIKRPIIFFFEDSLLNIPVC